MIKLEKIAAQKYILLVLLADGLIWARSSYGKFTSGDFVSGLAGTLVRFASKNPYPWYKEFLQNGAIPNAVLLGQLILFGELFVAVATVVGAGYLLFSRTAGKWPTLLLALGLLGGAMLNLNFWLAAGWTSPSTETANLLMLAIEVIGLGFVGGLLKKAA